MKRSRGYFCKVNNQLDDAYNKASEKHMYEMCFCVPYKQKTKRRLALKLYEREEIRKGLNFKRRLDSESY